MPRPPFFGDETPKLVTFLKKLSEWHRRQGIQLSLTTMAQQVRAAFPKSPPVPKQPKKPAGPRAKRKPIKDPLRHIIYKLCKKHSIWFGKPEE